MKTTHITEIVTENLRRGGMEKFPATALDWLVQDIETKLEAEAVKRIRKFMTPALVAKAVSQSYSKRTTRGNEAMPLVKPAASAEIPPLPASGG